MDVGRLMKKNGRAFDQHLHGAYGEYRQGAVLVVQVSLCEANTVILL